MTFTPIDQRARDEIRTALDRNLCVEAGAGTGKTTSLVDRIVELLATGTADADGLVVITFTEKAAAELSSRVRERLEAAIPVEADAERRARLDRAARDLYRARIETIHSFAAALLRERPVEAGLDPAFSVMPELEATLTLDRSYQAWLDGLMEGERREIERALNVGFGLEEIRETAETVHRLRFLLPLKPHQQPAPNADELVDWLKHNLGELRAIEGRCIDDEDKSLAEVAKLARFADRCDAEGTTPEARERLVAMATPGVRSNAGRQSSWADAEDCRGLKRLMREYSELREQLQGELRAAALLGVLPHAERFVRNYEAERRASGVADFDDLLIWARDLLRDRLDVRRYFQQRFSALLIDEFQDTDPIQVEIAVFLASDGQEGTDWRALEPVPGKLFVVGDPKQSIYRFRRADIAIYDEVKRGALAEGLRNITQNFRSLPGVIGWVNRVFNELFVEQEGLQPANVALDPVPSENGSGRPPVVVLRGCDDTLDADGVRRKEARSVAALLRSAVLEEKWQVRDRGTRELRPATWRDIAILLPARTGLEAYENALALAGVPYRHEGSRDYFRRQEVRDLIAMLRSIDDPTDRLSLLTALRSSAFGCSDDDFVIHAATGGAWDYRVTSAESEAQPVMEAFALLGDLHRARGRTSLAELVQRVVEESRLVEFALTLPDGPQAAANLLAVVDQARAFSAAGGGGLRAFTRFLVESTENEAIEVDAGIAEETDDVVRIMTMHGSKGLEFPIVVLANLASRGKNDSEPVPDEASRQLHLRVGSGGRRGHYATPGYDERWNHEKEALQAELIRLLYVAATRARDHLIVPYVKGKRTPGPFLTALEPLLPQVDGHEVAVDGVWLVDAAALPPAPEDEKVVADVDLAQVERALELREAWLEDHAELLRRAAGGATLTIASSVERSTRPMAAEASHSASTLLVSEGPPIPIGDALHLVMERVALPGADDLDRVTEVVCAEGGLLEHVDQVRDMARRCIDSAAVSRALAVGSYRREVPFTVTRNGGFARGRVDLVFRSDGGLVVVDYKTDSVEGEDYEAWTQEHHAGQAEVYAEALSSATEVPVREVVFVYCRSGVEVTVRP